jgi:hypothetical protein
VISGKRQRTGNSKYIDYAVPAAVATLHHDNKAAVTGVAHPVIAVSPPYASTASASKAVKAVSAAMTHRSPCVSKASKVVSATKHRSSAHKSGPGSSASLSRSAELAAPAPNAASPPSVDEDYSLQFYAVSPAPTTPPTAPIAPSPPVARSLVGSPPRGVGVGKKMRAVSVRKDVKGVPLSHTKLMQLVQDENKGLPKHMQLKNLKQKDLKELDAWLDSLIALRETAALSSQIAAAQHRMTPAIHRQCCMRMLMLISTRPELMELFKESRSGTSQKQLDAGCNQHVNVGQGMGLNHQFHVSMNAAFNDSSIVSDFPYDYTPSLTLPCHSNAVDKVATPVTFLQGLFGGLGLKQPLFPTGFPSGYFDIAKLDTIFQGGMSEYHAQRSRFHQSGNHNRPPWFFVSPVMTLLPEKQEEYIHLDAKRWDALAFHCVFEEIQELKNFIGKEIPGGMGGMPIKIEPGSSSRAVVSKKNQQQAEREAQSDDRDRELHQLRVDALKEKAKARASISTALMLQIRDQLSLKKEFEAYGDSDMVDVAATNIARLKDELAQQHVASSSVSLSLTPVATSSTGNRTQPQQPHQLFTQ